MQRGVVMGRVGVKNGVKNNEGTHGRCFIGMNYLMFLIYVDFEQKNTNNIRSKETLNLTVG